MTGLGRVRVPTLAKDSPHTRPGAAAQRRSPCCGAQRLRDSALTRPTRRCASSSTGNRRESSWSANGETDGDGGWRCLLFSEDERRRGSGPSAQARPHPGLLLVRGGEKELIRGCFTQGVARRLAWPLLLSFGLAALKNRCWELLNMTIARTFIASGESFPFFVLRSLRCFAAVKLC